MKNKADYNVHEDIYKQTKEGGFEGWGGPSAPERTKDWELQVECLLKHTKNWPQAGTLLELGCGEGKLSFILARSGYDVTAIDVSETAITWAKEKAQKNNQIVDFKTMSVVDLDSFKNETFDIVFDSLCAHCIIGSDRKIMFNHIHRILRNDGVFLLNSICGGKQSASVLNPQNFDEKTNCEYRDDSPYRFIGTEEELVQELTSAGFILLKKEILYHQGKPQNARILVKKNS